MSKKNVLLDLGASTSKVRQQKKKLDDEILRNYEELEVVEEPSSVKKKLRKSSDINKYEEFVPD